MDEIRLQLTSQSVALQSSTFTRVSDPVETVPKLTLLFLKNTPLDPPPRLVCETEIR